MRTDIKRKTEGFGLIEMMASFAILIIVTAGAYQFFAFAARQWSVVESDSAIMQDMNLGLLRIGKDIRSAKVPNNTNMAVEVLGSGSGFSAGQRMHMYVDGDDPDRMHKIFYHLVGNELMRGVLISPETSEPYFTGSDVTSDIVWSRLLTGIENRPGIFTDETYRTDDRRLIRVEIVSVETSVPFHLETVLMSRSRRDIR